MGCTVYRTIIACARALLNKPASQATWTARECQTAAKATSGQHTHEHSAVLRLSGGRWVGSIASSIWLSAWSFPCSNAMSAACHGLACWGRSR